MGLIKVVVADDDEMIRTVMSEVMSSDPRFEVVGEAADGIELLEVVTRTRCDVVILDVRMPSGGEEAAAALHSGPPVVVVAVSAETSPDVVAGLLRAGAQGYVAKGRLGPNLPDLVSRCLAGEVIVAVPTGAQALRQLAEGR